MIKPVFPILEEAFRLQRLTLPAGKISMVLDTDAYNEVDDQFAIAYALLSPERLLVEALYAAPFLNDRAETPQIGMEKSHAEILRLLATMGRTGTVPVYKGSGTFLTAPYTPVESEAARDLVSRAMARPEGDPLHVVAIGAITNVASALLMEPAIINKIVVVWLGGEPLTWHSAEEYNLSQDVYSARLVFDSGVPLVHIPALGVSSHLLASIPELEAHLKGKNPLCDILCELFAAYTKNPFAWAKEIWDIAAIAYLINPSWVPAALVHSPILTDFHTYSMDYTRHFIKSAYFACRNPIFLDMLQKLAAL